RRSCDPRPSPRRGEGAVPRPRFTKQRPCTLRTRSPAWRGVRCAAPHVVDRFIITRDPRMTPIVDSHHHIWRQVDLPWLVGPMQPRIFGPYEPIRRDYDISEYLNDLAGTGVTRSVYVQTNWAKEQFTAEVAWVTSVAEAHGFPDAIVGYADFTVPDVRPQLDRLARYPLLRGLRM